jgi:electron transfer flavoprotein beta subunit
MQLGIIEWGLKANRKLVGFYTSKSPCFPCRKKVSEKIQLNKEVAMNIAVLIKSVIATDESIVVRDGVVQDTGAKRTINPYDEYGLEEALRFKEAHGGTVCVIAAGPDQSIDSLRTALAMGADEAIWISCEFDQIDEYTSSLLLAAALRRRAYDLVFAGHLSVDNGAGQVAIRLAELLGWPHAGAVIACERIADATLRITRDAEGDSESWELPLPALITAQQGLNEPRYPALAGIMKAKRKPLTELSPVELGVEIAGVEAAPRTMRFECEAPQARPAGRKLVGPLQEQAAELLALLRSEAKVLEMR